MYLFKLKKDGVIYTVCEFKEFFTIDLINESVGYTVELFDTLEELAAFAAANGYFRI